MSREYLIFLVSFIVVLSVFAYINTKIGFQMAIRFFLKIFLPMILSGIIVKISQFISSIRLVSYIVGGIGVVIFFIVLQSAIKKPLERVKPTIASHFFGFLLGVIQGWLVIGFFVDYLDFFNILKIHQMIPKSFFDSIVLPMRWVLFLDFIKFY